MADRSVSELPKGGGVRLGLALYTVRDECARDFSATLREVAAIGFAGVELHDLYGHTPAEVARMLDETGLIACARHAPLDVIEALLPEAAESEVLRWRRLVVSWVDPARLDAALVGRLETAAANAAGHGLELGFHNHDAEVRPRDDGRSFVDELIAARSCPSSSISPGRGTQASIRSPSSPRSARFQLVHVKDFHGREGQAVAPVGNGAVGYERVAPAAVAAGVEWLLVEQEETDRPSLDAARRSFGALGTMLEVGA